MNYALYVLSSLLYKSFKPIFSCLDHRGHCRIYIKSSTWHHISIILAATLDSEKFCINYVEAGAKWPKRLKLSSKAKNGRTLDMHISTVTRFLTLIFGWKISKGVISQPMKGFSKLSILTELLLAKNVPNKVYIILILETTTKVVAC